MAAMFSAFEGIGDTMKTMKINEHVVTYDDADHDFLSRFHWRIIDKSKPDNKPSYYAVTSFQNSHVTMQFLVMGNHRPGSVIDHRDVNGLNNQRANLRFCQQNQNRCNTKRITSNRKSIYKGVCYCAKYKHPWSVKCVFDGQKRYSRHATEEEAARAYDAFAKELHGDFAYLNFPDTLEPQDL